jgi:hypothetical protein
MACSLCSSTEHNRRRCVKNPAAKNPAIRAPEAGYAELGRPVEHEYFEIFADLEEPPDDPLARCTWAQGIVSRCLFLTLKGKGSDKINDQIRRLAHSVAELTPKERLFKAEQIIRGDSLKTKPQSRKAGTQPVNGKTSPLR